MILTALIAIAIIITLFVYNEKHTAATIGLILTVVAYGLLKKLSFVSVIDYLSYNWLSIVLIVVGYLALGVIWSFYKYYLMVKAAKRAGEQKGYIRAHNYIGEIIGWMSYWPLSVILYFISDFVANLFRWIYNMVAKVYDDILNSVYKEENA